MKYTEEDFKKADLEIENLIKSGKYKQLDMKVLNNINNIEIDEATLKKIKSVLLLYHDYLDELDTLDSKLKNEFLTAIKGADIIDNQKLEKEDSFLMAIYIQSQKKFAIDEILKYKRINPKLLNDIHELLLANTPSNEFVTYGYRTNNRKYVGEIINGERVVSYFPVDYKKIPIVAEKITEYYNNTDNEQSEIDIFIKPIIIHGLVAAYQMFDDGNTRLARLMQHAKIFELTNKFCKYKLVLPAVYASRTYYPYRATYRNLINNLILNNNNESWNEWIKFNLDRIEDRLYYSIEKVEKLQSQEIHVPYKK